ncbi:uncharacterized protein DUF58 [Mobilisporobacter senegalensis]|uniref:Uncharacterized protein DUF58 n=1 Tax=Mobilisporobacter senegalensis TaxID=1329262 RepID=A0A3N1XP67_9FIRM|nr:transglutaminase domain-containing protein [Mobilisporobacter senegalensis]ROR28474.1 uncharacterized protein DUF58 [Mobilisporobacter senegalensis]
MVKNRIILILSIMATAVFASFYGGNIPFALFYMSLIIPVICLLYNYYVYLRFKIYQAVENKTVIKGEVTRYIFKLTNEDILPYHNIKVNFYRDKSRILGIDEDNQYSLLPGESKTMETSICCRYRGEYYVGARSVTITDFLYLFSITYPIQSNMKISVLPRIGSLTNPQLISLNADSKYNKRGMKGEEEEADCEVRRYLSSDSKKIIHWKASAKKGELLVRQYISIPNRGVNVYMDLVPLKNETELAKVIIEDKIIESTLALADYCRGKRIPFTGFFHQEEMERITISRQSDLDEFYQRCVNVLFRGMKSIDQILKWGSGDVNTNIQHIVITHYVSEDLYKTLAELIKCGAECGLILIIEDISESKKHLIGLIKELGTNTIILMFDFHQMLYGFYLYNIRPQESEILLKNCRAEITYHKIKTKSVFYPLKTYQLESDTISYDSTGPNLYGDKLMKRGAAYEISYYEINYESDTIKNYLRKISRTDGSGKQPVNQSFNNDEFRTYLEEILYNHYLENYPMEDNFIEKMREHTKLIKNEFTKLPVVSDRVKNLAKEITKSHNNDYDKLKAIERYLSAYTYTLSPPKPEKVEDTIESFLFENKKGYCTYFATAMAVLGRCVGIPVRYVEGLVVNYDDYDGENYLVKNSASHAWAEAYMEGFGWVPFEPTPGRYHERFYMWEDRKTVSTVSNSSSPHEWESILNEQAEENKKIIHLEKMQQTRYMFHICVIILGGFAGLPLIYIFILKYGKKNRFLKAASNEKAKYLLGDILKFLKMDGYKLISGETLYDYGKRINHRSDFDEITLERVFTLYNNIRYSKNEIKPEDIESMILYYNCLKKKMIKKSKWNNKVKIYFSTIAYK